MRGTNHRGTIGKLLTAAVIAVAGAGSVNADFKEWTINISGLAEEICSLPNPGEVNKFLPNLVTGDANVNTTKREILNLNPAFCNYQVNIGIKSANGGLLNGDPAAYGVSNMIKYDARVTWGDRSFTLKAEGIPVFKNDNLGPTKAPLTVELTPIADAANNILASGQYSDTLTLRVGAEL